MKKVTKPLSTITLICLVFCGVSAATAQDVTSSKPVISAPAYTPVDLGTLGGTTSYATAINERGQVVGRSDTATGKAHAFIWDNGVMTDLGVLDGSSRADYSIASAINNRGEVVGASVVTTPVGVATHHIIWKNDTIIDLGTLEGGTLFAINDKGQVIGYRGDEDNTMAFIWEDGVMTDLGTIRGGYSKPLAINNQGEVTGISDGSAFIWRKGIMEEIPQNSLPDAYVSRGQGINESGAVAGMVIGQGPYWEHDPFVWHKDTVTVLSIGSEPTSPCRPSSVYFATLNNSGQVAGNCQTGNFISTAFVWDRGTTTFLPTIASQGSPGSSSQSSQAAAINGSGKIAGSSTAGPSIGFSHATVWVRR